MKANIIVPLAMAGALLALARKRAIRLAKTRERADEARHFLDRLDRGLATLSFRHAPGPTSESVAAFPPPPIGRIAAPSGLGVCRGCASIHCDGNNHLYGLNPVAGP